MTAQNQASVTVQAAGTEVTVTAQPSASGAGTDCTITCNGQSVSLVFTGTDVMIDIHQ